MARVGITDVLGRIFNGYGRVHFRIVGTTSRGVGCIGVAVNADGGHSAVDIDGSIVTRTIYGVAENIVTRARLVAREAEGAGRTSCGKNEISVLICISPEISFMSNF